MYQRPFQMQPKVGQNRSTSRKHFSYPESCLDEALYQNRTRLVSRDLQMELVIEGNSMTSPVTPKITVKMISTVIAQVCSLTIPSKAIQLRLHKYMSNIHQHYYSYQNILIPIKSRVKSKGQEVQLQSIHADSAPHIKWWYRITLVSPLYRNMNRYSNDQWNFQAQAH